MTPARSSILTAAGRASTSSECPSRAVTVITAINVTVHPPPAGTSASKRRPHRKTSTGPRPPTRGQRITAIITSQPPRDWSGHELAVLLDVKPRHMLTQLREWGSARLLHPHRPRHLPAQHAASRHILDNRARSLTTRHCVAARSLRGLDAADASWTMGREEDSCALRSGWRDV
jgi:hypothetical protein